MTDLKVSRSTRNMPLSQLFLPAALVVLFALTMTGCGGGSDSEINRKPVFGEVFGAEGRNGYVVFSPKDSSIGPSATADLVDGKYEFTAQFGPVPGEYDVGIGFETTAGALRGDGKRGGVDPVTGERRGKAGNRGATAIAMEEELESEATVPTEGPYEIDLDVSE